MLFWIIDLGCVPGWIRVTPAQRSRGSFWARARAARGSRGVRAGAALGFRAGFAWRSRDVLCRDRARVARSHARDPRGPRKIPARSTGPSGSSRGACAGLARGLHRGFAWLEWISRGSAGHVGGFLGLARASRGVSAGLARDCVGLARGYAGLARGARGPRAGFWEGSSGARARFAYGSRGVRARFRGARARLRLSSFCLCAWLAPSLRRSCTRLALSSRGRRGRGSRWPRAGPQGAARSGRGRARRGGATSLRGAGPDFLCAFLRRYHAVNARAMVWTRLGLHFSTCSALRRCRASRFMRIALAALPRASGATDLARARP